MTASPALTRCHGLDALELTAPDGARATVLLHGGHVLSWVPAGGTEQLYLSPRSAFAPGQAVRGGVPVIFPQFSARGPLPRHGFARTRLWQWVRTEDNDREAVAVLRLSDDDATRALWPHAFTLELTVRLHGNELSLQLACHNQGEEAFGFTAALHTYLQVARLAAVEVRGLSGLSYWDAVDDTLKIDPAATLQPHGDVDRIYQDVRSELLLREAGVAGDRTLRLRQDGFEDVVVWNPGPHKCAALSDMPADGYEHMLCVEAARVARPAQLAPGASWAGTQYLALI